MSKNDRPGRETEGYTEALVNRISGLIMRELAREYDEYDYSSSDKMIK